jgi:hypothetical protein
MIGNCALTSVSCQKDGGQASCRLKPGCNVAARKKIGNYEPTLRKWGAHFGKSISKVFTPQLIYPPCITLWRGSGPLAGV